MSEWSTAGVDSPQQEATIILLLEAGAYYHHSLSGPCRPFHPPNPMVAHIIRHRSLNLIKSVVAAGADIESTTDSDICVLTLAAGRELDGAKVMDVLLEAGATFSSKKTRHNSVLEEALRFFGPP